MLKIKREGVILKKTELGFENEGVLNPAVIREGDIVHMFYRAVRKGNYSTIGYCRLEGPLHVIERFDTPVIFPHHEYEKQGTEDPRIVRIDSTYYLSFTCYDGVTAYGALALSTDLKHFEKQGIITPRLTYIEFKLLTECKKGINKKYAQFNKLMNQVWDKNFIFFPRRINGNLCFIHRIKPDIQFVSVPELVNLTQEFWETYFMNFQDHILLCPKYDFESSYIGGGCPPIETQDGWLLIYHGVHDHITGYIYSIGVALLDLDDPLKVLARLPYPILKPEKEYEKEGEVNNVCFPTGSVIFHETLYIYYGAADEQIACASLNINELLAQLSINKN